MNSTFLVEQARGPKTWSKLATTNNLGGTFCAILYMQKKLQETPEIQQEKWKFQQEKWKSQQEFNMKLVWCTF